MFAASSRTRWLSETLRSAALWATRAKHKTQNRRSGSMKVSLDSPRELWLGQGDKKLGRFYPHLCVDGFAPMASERKPLGVQWERRHPGRRPLHNSFVKSLTPFQFNHTLVPSFSHSVIDKAVSFVTYTVGRGNAGLGFRYILTRRLACPSFGGNDGHTRAIHAPYSPRS